MSRLLISLVSLKGSVGKTTSAFNDASEQPLLVRDVKTNKLAGKCWENYGEAVSEMLSRMEAGA